MEVIKLIGVLIVIVGFILKLDTPRRCCRGRSGNRLVAGMSPMKILETLGTCIYHKPYRHSFHSHIAGHRNL